ncbi:hypothetical protein [Roseovarius lutimaris]|uniref:hypothetical protein n=1 Tax=Roseovarius lutimaris TaxID=1005928 RepID=UPI001160B051|nr:hypothetical protein [Roseovarius lutimaris]
MQIVPMWGRALSSSAGGWQLLARHDIEESGDKPLGIFFHETGFHQRRIAELPNRTDTIMGAVSVKWSMLTVERTPAESANWPLSSARQDDLITDATSHPLHLKDWGKGNCT